MVSRSLRKGIGKKKEGRKIRLIQRAIRTLGALIRVTVMPVVSAVGEALKQVIDCPGKQKHFRRIRGRIQTLHDMLLPCYLIHSESSAVDSAIIYDWATNFITETKDLRSGNQKLLLLLDGYGAQNGIIVIALPSHITPS